VILTDVYCRVVSQLSQQLQGTFLSSFWCRGKSGTLWPHLNFYRLCCIAWLCSPTVSILLLPGKSDLRAAPEGRWRVWSTSWRAWPDLLSIAWWQLVCVTSKTEKAEY
jgi:hypothetical protein